MTRSADVKVRIAQLVAMTREAQRELAALSEATPAPPARPTPSSAGGDHGQRDARDAADALRERDALLSNALRIAHMGTWVFDIARGHLWWSPETHRLFGVAPGEFAETLDAFLALILDEDRARELEAINTPCGEFESEYRIGWPDGSVRWMYERGTLECNAAGLPIRRLGVVMDITARKQAEEERRELLAREQAARKQADAATRYYRSLFESAPGCYLVLTPDKFEIVAVSEAYLAATMTERDVITGRVVFDVFPDDPDDPSATGVQTLRASLERVKASHHPDVMAVIRYPVPRSIALSGPRFEERFWSPVNSPVMGPDGELAYIIHRVEDVTSYIRLKQQTGEPVVLSTREGQLEADIVLRSQELARANERLQQSEKRFRLLAKATNDTIWDWDLQSNALWWNEGITTLFGYRQNEIEPEISSWSGRIHAADRERVEASVHAAIDRGAEGWADEYRFRCSDGSYAYVLDRGHVLRDKAGKAVRMIGGMTDLTERKKAEEKLREQATLLDGASDAILVRDLSHRIHYWNRGAEQLYGFSAAEAVGNNVFDLLYGADSDAFLRATHTTLEQGEWSGELEQKTKDGRIVTVLGRWTLLRDDAGQPRSILVINTDITERKQLEDQLLRAQRMESIGTLAGGIAHDLNNMLAPILMSCMMLQDGETDPARLVDLRTIENCTQRGAAMLRQLLSFARGGGGRRSKVDLRNTVAEVQSIVRDTFPKDIRFELEVPYDPVELDADPTQMHQLVMNLCVNARDAMPDGGILSVSLTRTVRDDVRSDAKPGPYLCLRVEDTGTGIPAELTERIFDPFFTTKETGKGTGLGLSTVHAIVRRHGGFIEVRSEPGKGACFRVYFPIEESDLTPKSLAPAPATLPFGQGELILVVDDEESIRNVVGRTLLKFGYRVITAVNGAEAVVLYAQHRPDIAAVLTDMNMPVMDGVTTIASLRAIDPNVRIVGSSGLQASSYGAEALEAGAHAFLPKPYSTESLLSVLKGVLRRPG